MSEQELRGQTSLERPWLMRKALWLQGFVLSGTRSNDQIPALTGLRALAAWLVWLFHTKLYEGQPAWMTRLSMEGYVGVTIFFVLSGYLITLRCYDTSRLERGWFGSYARNRFARIYPVYLAITIPSLIVYRSNALTWFTSLTLTGGFFDPPRLIVQPAWSLTVEECFYFTAPLLFFLIRRGFVQGFLLPLGAAALVVLAVSMSRTTGPDGLDGFRLAMSTYPGRILEFLLGGWAAILHLNGRVRGRSGRFTYAGIAAFVLVMALLVYAHGPELQFRHQVFTHLVAKLVLPWSVVLFVLGFAMEETSVSRLLGHPILILCGRASYTFYLIHMGLVAGILVKLGVHGVLHFVALNLISIGMFLCFEEPMRRLIRGERQARAPRVAPA